MNFDYKYYNWENIGKMMSKSSKYDVAVIGSRSFNDYSLLSKNLNYMFKFDMIKSIVSGGAKGADSLGERYAIENNIPTKIFYPDWNKYGKRAGFLRNEDIIKNSDIVISFWDLVSKGTKHSIDLSLKNNKLLIINTF